MATKARVLDLVLEAYRQGDLDECIRLVRTLVEAAPQATAPRQLLAALFTATGNGRLALAHYKRLLPEAVQRGEVIRAIAFQKQIDVFEQPGSLAPGRWMMLQRQLRERGLAFESETTGTFGRPWTGAQLLALPRAWFERIAAETRFEILGLEHRGLDVEAGTVWEMLAGRMRWSFALADGRASAEALAAEGDAVHVDPGLADTARVTLAPELPVEVLRFDATLARDLKLALTTGLHVSGMPSQGLTPEARALLPTRPRRREDLDDAPLAPLPNPGTEPLRLPPLDDGNDRFRPPAGDGAGWVDFGMRSLPEPPATAGESDTAPAAPSDASSADTAAVEATAFPSSAAADDEHDTDPPPPSDLPASIEAPPSVDESSEPAGDEAIVAGAQATGEPVDAAEELLRGSGAEPIAGAFGDPDAVVERRRHPRVTVSFASRVALLRLAGPGLDPVEGQLSDLSTSGFNIRFVNRILGASRGALADAVVAVDMNLPGPQGGLRVAAQVRWLDADDTRDDARMGIEFVLLTETDRRRIAGTLARAALALREQERKAA